MEVLIREFRNTDLSSMVTLWNFIVAAANAFPQKEPLTIETAETFFSGQTFTGVAVWGEQMIGLYILHPNNVGRCGHIANASYAVDEQFRGLRIGEKLVRHSLRMARKSGFLKLQFNAVICTNTGAIRLYERLGFHKVGVIPGGYALDNGRYEDIFIYYIDL
jgi:ribosomal protein S18 acetylase RimI-like enzyme